MYEYDENGNCVKRMEIYTDGSGVIYEYECDKCGAFEVMQKISEAPLTECETCHGPVHRLVSHHTSFQLKGGGWYKDLYSSSSSGSSSSSSSSSS